MNPLRELDARRVGAMMGVVRLATDLGFRISVSDRQICLNRLDDDLDDDGQYEIDIDFGVEEFDDADQLRTWLEGWKRSRHHA